MSLPKPLKMLLSNNPSRKSTKTQSWSIFMNQISFLLHNTTRNSHTKPNLTLTNQKPIFSFTRSELKGNHHLSLSFFPSQGSPFPFSSSIRPPSPTEPSSPGRSVAMASSEPTRPISIKVAARKLPIKRKNPNHDDLLTTINPNPNPLPIPKIETAQEEDDDDDGDGDEEEDIKRPAPFKFHRIWTEIDEIRFLQGLLDSSSQGLIFPRDLPLFYLRFSGIMSQPYTKSQLSEKLRRLRKKFRVISGRISRGLDESLLTPHDQSLFELCKKLWHPNHSSLSPFQASSKRRATGGVRVVNNDNVVVVKDDIEIINNGDDKFDNGYELNRKNVNVGDESKKILVKTIMDVFDKSLEDVRSNFVRRGMVSSEDRSTTSADATTTVPDGNVTDLMRRCREQRFAELDVLARRMRLVLEHSTNEQ